MATEVEYVPRVQRNALVVHSDLGVLAAMQAAASKEGLRPVLCRDLPTALLAIAQHRFELCVISVAITEAADGWALAGVLHMCFPNAYIAMMAPEPDLLMLQMAINSGVTQLYLASRPSAELAAEVLRDCNSHSPTKQVQ